MKVTATLSIQRIPSPIHNLEFSTPLSHPPMDDIVDASFVPIASICGRSKSVAERAEQIYGELMNLGGPHLITYMLNVGQLIGDGLAYCNGHYIYGLKKPFSIWDRQVALSMVAAHFTDWTFQLAEESVDGIPGNTADFKEFIQSLRDIAVSLNNM